MPSKVRYWTHRAAFSLVELMVVISIIVLLLAIAVPAFSSMLYSSEQSLAESSLRIALNTARDVAARSPVGQDSAAVFLYERDSRKMSVLVCTKAGVLQDQMTDGSRAIITREVFAAAPGVETIQMTAGWTVRGFAPANSIDGEWYGDAVFGTYPTAVQRQGNWVFPETSFFDDINARADGSKRQTFMVRFEGGTGLVKSSDFAAVLVLSPSPGESFRNSWPTLPGNPSGGAPSPPWTQATNNPLNPTHAADQLRFAQSVLSWPTLTTVQSYIPLTRKREILGGMSSDTILAKGVGQVALCNEGRLARSLGVRTSDTGSLYIAPPQPMAAAYAPQLLPTVTTERINEWIENRLLDNNNELIDSDCRVFTLQRYLGWLQEVTGTSGGLGVGS